MQQYFHLTGVLGRWLYAARRLALLERAIGSKPPRRWLYLAVFRTGGIICNVLLYSGVASKEYMIAMIVNAAVNFMMKKRWRTRITAKSSKETW